mmetsp:Transcript_91752/g.285996  ORF Transcript_91752/g.285996 Transcript_91752/m.285996 type:complete len:264 (+) Transcript_91752:68-859(+)
MTTLSINVVSAGPLEGEDGLLSKSDPYVYISIDGCDSQQTDTVQNDNTPEWNQTLTFEGVEEPCTKIVSFKIYDEDSWRLDEKIGACTLQLNTLQATPDPQEFEMVCDEGWLKDATIKFSVQTDGSWGNPPGGTGALRVNIGDCTGLDDADFSGTTDPYAYVQIDGCDAQQTEKKEGTINPDWNQDLNFEVENPLTKTLKITIYDDDTWSRDDKIGYCEVPLSELKMGAGEVAYEKTVDYCFMGLVKQATLRFSLEATDWGSF